MLQAGLTPFGNHEIDGFRSHELHIRAGRIKVRVIGNDVSLLTGDGEQNAFRRPALVRRDYMLVAEDVLDGIAKMIEAAPARVALIAVHEGRPLTAGHRASSR